MTKYKLYEVPMIRFDRDMLERATELLIDSGHLTIAVHLRLLVKAFDDAPFTIEDDSE